MDNMVANGLEHRESYFTLSEVERMSDQAGCLALLLHVTQWNGLLFLVLTRRKGICTKGAAGQ